MNRREIIPLKQGLDFELVLPGSKSITNRAFLCAALADGKSRLFGVLGSDDTAVMLRALQKIEIRKSKIENGIEIDGCGGKFKKGNLKFDLHNSGTSTRFLAAVMAAREGETIITGDKRMKERPITDLVDGLKQIGCSIEYLEKRGFPPIRIQDPGFRIQPKLEYFIKMRGDKSSQYFSALLMLGPLLPKPLRIEVIGDLVSKPYIDTTISVMKAFGVLVENNNYKTFVVKPQKYKATDYRIEGDASAASYWSSIAYLHGGRVRFENLDLKKSIQGDAKYNDVLISQLSKVKSQRSIDMSDMPDSAMTLACTAPFVKGETKITGLSTLRLKETDRLTALQTELRKIGVKVTMTKDSLLTEGGIGESRLQGKENVAIDTYNDHRMAMCFAVVGTKIPGIVIEDPDCVDKTYPEFWNDLERMYLSKEIRLGQKNLVLTGMRGAGKTFLGKKIARLLGRKFVDLDSEIEKTEGMPVAEIVNKNGWEHFRKAERKICSKSADTKNLVISAGGGVVLNPDNMKALKKNGVNVFIFSDPQILARRIRKTSNRPALKTDDPISELQSIWNERRGLYLKYADYVWDNTGGKIVKESLERVFA